MPCPTCARDVTTYAVCRTCKKRADSLRGDPGYVAFVESVDGAVRETESRRLAYVAGRRHESAAGYADRVLRAGASSDAVASEEVAATEEAAGEVAAATAGAAVEDAAVVGGGAAGAVAPSAQHPLAAVFHEKALVFAHANAHTFAGGLEEAYYLALNGLWAQVNADDSSAAWNMAQDELARRTLAHQLQLQQQPPEQQGPEAQLYIEYPTGGAGDAIMTDDDPAPAPTPAPAPAPAPAPTPVLALAPPVAAAQMMEQPATAVRRSIRAATRMEADLQARLNRLGPASPEWSAKPSRVDPRFPAAPTRPPSYGDDDSDSADSTDSTDDPDDGDYIDLVD